MVEIHDKKECSGCGTCAAVCPKKCIEMLEDKEGFLYPKVNINKCVKCDMCDKVCPFKNTYPTKVYKVYGFNSIDEMNRLRSSSGGFFSVIAGLIIAEKGIVFGVGMTADCRESCYYVAEDMDGLKKLIGSKYIQVEAGKMFEHVKEQLETGRKVLYSGTPCAVNGLRRFLGNDYENLICVDVVCHGVPSKKIWMKHLEYVEKEKKIVNVSFRYKKDGWQNFSMGYICQDQGKILVSKDRDFYMIMFLNNYSLRPSCYACRVKGNNTADITMGDFWGGEDVIPDLYDGKGSSLVILRSEKGQKIFEAVKAAGKYKEVSYPDAVRHNTPEFKSVAKPKRRKEFYDDLNKVSYEKIIEKYCSIPFSVKLKDTIKSALRKKGISGGN